MRVMGTPRDAIDPLAGPGRTGDRQRRHATSPHEGAAADNPLAPGAQGTDRATRAVYVISVAAELAGVHPQTLRVYERKGLLDPSRTRGGSRRFSDQDLARLRRIQQLTTAGLNLEGVRRVLELEAEVASLRAELERVRAEARESLERTHRHYRRDLVPVSQAPVPFVRLDQARSGR
ncbi:MAG TPA: helix-turn-helix transcriptional regulator [Acidimicrobiales bacterium]|nr:helix-turn-helix transcriptional regulator [Acidimicrobiales bacterium]